MPRPPTSFPHEPTAAVGGPFFSAFDTTNGQELWKSDGTLAGTTLVKDIRPGAGDSYPFALTDVAGTLFFAADDGTTSGYELWKSNGTDAGTVRLTPFVVDMTPPDTTITSGPAAGSTITTSSATFGFSGTVGDTAALQCSLDGAPFAACTSPKTFTGLANGAHTVAFRAVDAAGNIDATPATRAFTVNVAATPPSNSFSLPASGKANTKKATLTLTVALPGKGTLALAPVGKAPVKASTKTAKGAGSVKIKIKLTPAGLAKIKAKKNGKLKVKVSFTYTPTGGTAKTLTKKYTLIFKK